MGQRAGDFVVAGAVAELKHCAVKLFGKTHDIGSQKTGFKLKHTSLLDELVGHKAGRCHPQDDEGDKAGRCHPQDDEGDLSVFLAITQVIKVGELGFRPEGVKVVPGNLCIFLHCSVNILECLNSMTLPAELLIDKVEALSPFPGSRRLFGLQLLDRFIVTLVLFVDARASQHHE